jgi:hypothetical protein
MINSTPEGIGPRSSFIEVIGDSGSTDDGPGSGRQTAQNPMLSLDLRRQNTLQQPLYSAMRKDSMSLIGRNWFSWRVVRTRNLPKYVLFILACVLGPLAAFADDKKPPQTVDYDSRSAQSLGDVRIFGGRAALKVTHLNPLRYRYQISRTVTLTPGPDIGGIAGIPPVPKVASPQQNQGVTPAFVMSTPLTEAISTAIDIQSQLDNINNMLRDTNALVDAADPQNTAEVTCALNGTICANGAPPGQLISRIETVLHDSNDLFAKIEKLRSDLVDANSYISGLSKSASDQATATIQRAKVTELQTFLTAVDQQKTAIQDSQKALAQFDAVFHQVINAGDSAYTMTEPVDCGAFSKTVKLSLIRTARRDGDNTSGTNEMITFDCPALLSVSAGVGITLLPRDRSFFIKAPTTPSGTSTFAQQNNSRVAPIPVVQVNARITEWNEIYGLYASVGAVVDVGTGTAGAAGTAIDYIFGPTLALRHAQFLITPALHLGKVADLTGFKVGDTVPSTVTSPPTQLNYHAGFAITITYRIK